MRDGIASKVRKSGVKSAPDASGVKAASSDAGMNRRTACLLLGSGPVIAADLLNQDAGEPARPWIGPDFWSNPLQDWQYRNGRMECIVSGADRHVYILTRELSAKAAPATLRVTCGRLEGDQGALSPGFVGFRIGIQGIYGDYRDSAIYGVGMNAGIATDGRLFIGEANPGQAPVGGFPRAIDLELKILPAGSGGFDLLLSALDERGAALSSVTRTGVSAQKVQGGMAVVCSAGSLDISQSEADREITYSGINMRKRGREGNVRFWFRNLSIAGGKVDHRPERAFGPILWTMYTVSRNVLKLSAQMAPVGERSQPVQLQVLRGGKWRTVASSRIDPLARNAAFRVANWDASRPAPYRVAYSMGGDHFFTGTIQRDPVDKRKITVAVLSCLNDFGFPHTDLLESIRHFQPDLLAFEGDQIYERVASYGIERLPLERATLDYLRKWFLFGWSFRDLLRDTPAVCMPDDHDVFHGNVWGAGGKHAEGPAQQAAQDSGGYVEPAAWVNMAQRTQTSHLPDPYDPTPVQQGIGVYYTDLRWGGVSFAILEDRKWKSAPKVMVPAAEIVNGWAQNPAYNAARDGNAPGAELLGPRQLKFLDEWAQDWRGVWMKAALSQTLFANVATLPPPANTDAVCPKLPILRTGQYAEGDVLAADHDSNGWPQSGRDAAVRALRRCAAVHLCGDQHIASTVQYGVGDWNDGAFALCSPALSNIFPRRWFPPAPGRNPLAHSPRNTGEYVDGFGNKITVHAVFNPEQMEERPNLLLDRSPGFAMAEFDRDSRQITLTVWPRREDVRRPGAKPASGWPVTIHQLDNGWSSAGWVLPLVQADGRQEFCVQVIREPSHDIVYTLRVQGESFAPPAPAQGSYTVRVFEPDDGYERIYRGQRAARRPGHADPRG